MGTFAQVVVIAESQDAGLKCIRAAMAEIHRVDDLMSDYKSDSDIGRVNEKASEIPVPVSESTFEVLRRSVEFSKLTDGAFDVTVGPLMDLFRQAKEKGIAATPEQIAEAKLKVGFEKLKLDSKNRTVQFAVEAMRLDLGGIAKGYAIDKAIEAVRRSGALGGMVDIGGDIRCFGSPPEGRENWLIAVQDPNPDVQNIGGSGLLLTLKVTDVAVTTSGDYQQYVMIEGKRRSHIMNRQTGKSAEGLSSVTIIADERDYHRRQCNRRRRPGDLRHCDGCGERPCPDRKATWDRSYPDSLGSGLSSHENQRRGEIHQGIVSVDAPRGWWHRRKSQGVLSVSARLRPLRHLKPSLSPFMKSPKGLSFIR
jgi:thiamine biosynthesis lipoprotein